MVEIRFILFVFCLWITQHFVRAHVNPSELPAILYKPINESLSEIKQILDDVEQQTHKQQALTIPVLIEMNRSIGDQGPFDSHLGVAPHVYSRFLSFVDELAQRTGEKMTHLFYRATRQIGVALLKYLTKDDVAKVVRFLKFIIFEIAPKIGLITADNRSRYWGIYEWVAEHLILLQAQGCQSSKEYTERLEKYLDYGVRRFNRYINDVSNRLDEYSSVVAQTMVDIIADALSPKFKTHGIQVEPFIRDKFDL